MRVHSLAATIRTCLLAVTMLGSFSGASLAGPNANAKILLHLLTPTTKGQCTRAEATPPCSSIVTAGDLYPATYFAYVLVTDADSAAGVAGAQFGIDYDGAAQSGVDIYGWTNCATLEFAEPGWPGAGTGNLITWNSVTTCQTSEPEGVGTGVKAVLGYFYCTAYTADILRVVPHLATECVKVASCAASEEILSSADSWGFTEFSSGAIAPGYNPCGRDTSSFVAGRQLEGDQEAVKQMYFVKTATTASDFVQTAQELRRAHGLRILLAIAPDGLVCASTNRDQIIETLRADSRVLVATSESRGNPRVMLSDTERIWNEMLGPNPPVYPTTSPFAESCLVASSQEQQRESRYHAGMLHPASVPPQDPDRQTSLFLMGDVGYKLIFPESNGSGPCPDENWTPARILLAKSYIQEILATFALSKPNANLCFWMPEAEAITDSPVEPIDMNLDAEHFDNYMNPAIEALGYNGGYLNGAMDFCNDKRMEFRLDSYFIAYIANSQCPQHDGTFGNTTAGGFAALNGPYLSAVMAGFGGQLPFIFLHEMFHVFGAADEFGNNFNCGEYHGYLRVLNGNADPCATNQESCIMGGMGPHEICQFTLGQLGLQDTDLDEILDPIDHPQSGVGVIIQTSEAEPGDFIDFYGPNPLNPVFQRRIVMSDRASQAGGSVWDGIRGDGAKAPSGPYLAKRNGSTGLGYRAMFNDVETPEFLYSPSILLGSTPLGQHRLFFSFQDEDTHAGIVRVSLVNAVTEAEVSRIVNDKFYWESGLLIDQVPFTIPSGSGSVFRVDVTISDIGGGHLVTGSATLDVTGVPDVTDASRTLAVSSGFPNPSTRSVEWQLENPRGEELEIAVFSASGRLVRRLGRVGRELSRMTVVWSGTDDQGTRVASGKYFLRAIGQTGVGTGGVILLK